MEADPLDDIRNAQRIRGIILNGKYMDLAALDEALTEVEAAARKERGDESEK